jgi:hypothetical protein
MWTDHDTPGHDQAAGIHTCDKARRELATEIAEWLERDYGEATTDRGRHAVGVVAGIISRIRREYLEEAKEVARRELAREIVERLREREPPRAAAGPNT